MKINDVTLQEGYMLRLERDRSADMLVLHVKDTKTGRRSEVRGKLGYETDGYDDNDPLHQLLDKVGRSASVSDMMNGDVVHINPKHPQGPHAEKAANKVTSESQHKTVSEATKDEILQRIRKKQYQDFIESMLESIHKLVQKHGDRHSIGHYAFEIGRVYGLEGRKIEKMYKDKYEIKKNINES